jgi:hypothetical protein
LRLLFRDVTAENRFAQFGLARRAGRLRILANIAVLSFRNFSAALWTFPERFLACEIDFRGGSMSLERENSSTDRRGALGFKWPQWSRNEARAAALSVGSNVDYPPAA